MKPGLNPCTPGVQGKVIVVEVVKLYIH